MSSGINKIIGYFSYTKSGNVFCDGDSCIIINSKQLMRRLLQAKASIDSEQDLIKKTTFGEVINGIELGASYILDKDTYSVFNTIAKRNAMNDLMLATKVPSSIPDIDVPFVRIQQVSDV